MKFIENRYSSNMNIHKNRYLYYYKNAKKIEENKNDIKIIKSFIKLFINLIL